MIKTKEEKLILIISSSIAVGLSLVIVALSFIIDEVKWTWSLSILMGQTISIGCFFKSNAIITKVLYDDRSHAKLLFILNNLIGLICYLVSLVFNMIVPGLNILLNGLGILLIKFVTFIVGTFYRK